MLILSLGATAIRVNLCKGELRQEEEEEVVDPLILSQEVELTPVGLEEW